MMKQLDKTSPDWYTIAHQILLACKPLAQRVANEGVTLMLTDTDWATLNGFEIILHRTGQSELLALCMAADLDRSLMNALLDLYHFRM